MHLDLVCQHLCGLVLLRPVPCPCSSCTVTKWKLALLEFLSLIAPNRAYTAANMEWKVNCLSSFHFPVILKLLWFINHTSTQLGRKYGPILLALGLEMRPHQHWVVLAHSILLQVFETLELMFSWKVHDFVPPTAICSWFAAILRISWRLFMVMWQLEEKDELILIVALRDLPK